MSFSREDQELQRYIDGELPAEDAAAFAARMLQDAGLRERVEAAEALRGGFAAADGCAAVGAPAGLTANVLAEVRRLPSRDQLRQIDVAAGAVQLCRRLLLAAAVLLGVGFAVYVGLFDGQGSRTLEAAPEQEIERQMERLDALILGGFEQSGRAGGK